MILTTPPFAVHCEWSDWVEGECSDSCGTGTRIKTRTKLVTEAHGGTCTGNTTEIEECYSNPCPSKKLKYHIYTYHSVKHYVTQ